MITFILLVLCFTAVTSRNVINIDNPGLDWDDIKDITLSPKFQKILKRLQKQPNIKNSIDEEVFEKFVSLKEPPTIGGKKVDLNQIPHHAHIIIDRQYRCGGTFITLEWVLTAAFCVHKSRQLDIYSVIDLKNSATFSTVAQRVVIHQNYDENLLQNDVGLIKLKTSLTCSDAVCTLPRHLDEDANLVGLRCTSSGFGSYFRLPPLEKPPIITELKYTRISIIGNEACSQYWEMHEKQICGIGDGDYGSGLFVGNPLYKNGSERFLIGVVSYGGFLCGFGQPSVYTKVSSYNTWINQQLVKYNE
ncbi:CLUMA_CG002596, isoform A [Clunio marinus]|uniref:CLUMA_CG002596, isoform A n=1 Tax=Clunio marinus TaxID=568069 RepID=A0A1J1HLX7_9DIPT|nr:CLUMA_CG002596, isoform A [Clunio marinus]